MSYIVTSDGGHFDFSNPRPEQIMIEDIAGSLAKECRFVGKCAGFYSVAQHSVLASYIVPQNLAREALLHDAAEAFIKDLPSPLKALLPDYRSAERRIEAVIRERFGLPTERSTAVRRADLVMLATERRDLMPDDGEPYGESWQMLVGIEPLSDRIVPWCSWQMARREFLGRYAEINERKRSST